MATNFITVTTTVFTTAFPLPSLNATQLADIEESKATGQVVAFIAMAVFALFAVILSICWIVLRIRRPPPPPMIENPDAMRHGKGAFLPLIGRSRKSDASLSLGGRGSVYSSVSSSEPRARRLSLWADGHDPAIPPMPSPQLIGAHSRSSSLSSTATERALTKGDTRRYSNNERSSTVTSHSARMEYGQVQGFMTRYHAGGMDSVPMDDTQYESSASRVQHNRVYQTPHDIDDDTREGGGASNGGHAPVVSPVSPEQWSQRSHARYGGPSMPRTYDSGMYS